jgi:hypothetical protein
MSRDIIHTRQDMQIADENRNNHPSKSSQLRHFFELVKPGRQAAAGRASRLNLNSSREICSADNILIH